MVQEPDEEVLISDKSPTENNSFKVVKRISKRGKSWQEQQPQVEEEHWQWMSGVFQSHHIQENEYLYGSSISNAPAKPKPKPKDFADKVAEESTLESAPPKPKYFTDKVAEEPTLGSAPPKPVPSETTAIEKTKGMDDDLENVEKIGSQSHSKCVVEIPRLELTKAKEIALQAKLETGAYVCQDCQIAVATSRGELGFHRRYPCLLFFCIFLNLMSIMSLLFCISILRTIYPHPAY